MRRAARGWGRWLHVLWVAMALAGCGGREAELCALADECENGNDADLEACESDLATVAEVASLYDCTEEWDELLACAIENNDCDDDNFEIDDSCENEAEDYEDCVD